MYSPKVIERNAAKIEKKTGLKLVRHEHAYVTEFSEHLQSLWNPAKSETIRPLTKEEQSFITNEQVLGQIDFKYWAERHHTIRLDAVVGAGIGKMILGDSQLLLLDKIAAIQEEQDKRHRKGENVDGILIADHKARQVWHTALARALTMHRATLWPHASCLAGSVDDQKINILYDCDMRCYDNLPWFMKTGIVFNEKSAHVQFSVKSKITYLMDSKKSSFGQGDQYNIAHCTEISEFGYPTRLEADMFPALPQSPDTLCILESRANGRKNWWHHFTEDVRAGRKHRWNYCFIPWYAEPRKYRRTPPEDWKPSEPAVLHAKKVYETSPEFIGKALYLPKEQLFWWETTREEYRSAGTLNLFLESYCATPEESFQHSGQSAFDPELMDELRLRAGSGMPFEFTKAA